MQHLHYNSDSDARISKGSTTRVESNIYAIPLAIASVVIIGIFLHFISDAFLTFVAALFLANIFMPLVSWLRKKKVPMVFAILSVLGLVACVLFGVAIVISTSVSSIIEVFPRYEIKWNQVFLPAITDLLGKISPALRQQAVNFDLNTLVAPSKIVSALSSATNLLSGFALILLFMLFILSSNGQFLIKIERAF